MKVEPYSVTDRALGAIAVVTPVLGFWVLIAWAGGYPGFGQWWLTHVVFPTWVSVVVLVFGWWTLMHRVRDSKKTNNSEAEEST